MIGSGFSWPLNFFAHALELEEGSIRYLHYGLYDREDQPVHEAQQNSTDLILSKLPAPPARILEVGIGLGTTAGILQKKGYGYVGITPDQSQIDLCAADGRELRCIKFEDMTRNGSGYDVIIFQESAQYIWVEDILRKAAEILEPGGIVVIADEVPASLIRQIEELTPRHGLSVEETIDLTPRVMPSFRYLLRILKKHFEELVAELKLDRTAAEGMVNYLDDRLAEYERGDYTYSLIKLRKPA
jgi:SAM-dependent methyltransferase